MNIHEYQAKALLKEFGAPVADGFCATSINEAEQAAHRLPGPVRVVKSQIHAGGRGKGHFKNAANGAQGGEGGVRLARSTDDVRAHAEAMLGNTLVTHQTGDSGKKVSRIYVEQGTDIDRELYLSLLVDRDVGQIAFVASTEGGMDIEAVAEQTPEKIHTLWIDPGNGVTDQNAMALCRCLQLENAAHADGMALARILYRAFVDKDMSLLEINPLVVRGNGRLLLLDAKISFDDNALFRHPDIAALRDETEEDQKEKEGAEWDLAYIALDGNIGCMVNGAGLAMATMDIIKLHGAAPANFCDVGGGASREKVTAAFKIIMKDPNVEAILVNIFGGIMKCDIIAEGVLDAVRQTGLSMPLIVRLEGTNVEKGKEIIAASGLNVTPANDLDDAARKIIAAIRA